MYNLWVVVTDYHWDDIGPIAFTTKELAEDYVEALAKRYGVNDNNWEVTPLRTFDRASDALEDIIKCP